jgi:hypothetical protein
LICNKTAIFILDKSDMKITLREIKVNKSREKPLIYTQKRMIKDGSTASINVTGNCTTPSASSQT